MNNMTSQFLWISYSYNHLSLDSWGFSEVFDLEIPSVEGLGQEDRRLHHGAAGNHVLKLG